MVLSPSRLNDYLSCPRKFFYVKVLGIDVEEADWDGANFGTLIHSLLERAVKVAKESAYPTLEEILEKFRLGMDGMKFSSEAKKEKYFKQGQKLLTNYYPYFSQIPISRITDIEFSFYGVDVDGDFITGKIDRIEKTLTVLLSFMTTKQGIIQAKRKSPQMKKNKITLINFVFINMPMKNLQETRFLKLELFMSKIMRNLLINI